MIKELDNYPIFKEFRHQYRQKILKYIVLAYKKNGELQKIPTLRERKLQACIKAGLDPDNKEIKWIIQFKNPVVNELISFYLSRIQNDDFYENYISNQELFWNVQQKIREPLDEGDDPDSEKLLKLVEAKGRLSDLADKLLGRIKSYEKVIFGENNDVKEFTQQQIRITPEMMASKAENGVQ